MTHTDLTISDEVSGFVYLEDDSGKKVLTVYGCSTVKIERAHRLALCWNTHDGLLEALELVKLVPRPWMGGKTVTWPEWDSAMEKIDAAIKKARS
jgi:hypothetical protein